MSTRHLLTIRSLETPIIEELIENAKLFRAKVLAGETLTANPSRVVGLVFFEGSTRTRVSFEQAAHYLGYRTTNFASQGSSMAKGETLRDTILTLRYERLEGLVIRHPASGSAQLAAQFFGSPVLNAGDGQHEHPTQALGDALTILDRKGRIEGLTVAIVGDILHSRVARSNAWLLSKLGATVRFVAPRTLMPSHMALMPGQTYYDLAAGIEGADVIMCLRLQRERMDSGLVSIGEFRRAYQINARTLKYAKKDCLVMHPGPINRGVELDDAAADGVSSAIRDQVENSIFVRMAAYDWVFGGHAAAGLKPSAKTSAKRPKSGSGGKK
ncbi:MAG: aspartate carbamoyltransferase catalytic subunit [Chthonomonas sp.]|nr:aspartate carbamoyltransferase catalytic subunit [Chthonomonas sp.]